MKHYFTFLVTFLIGLSINCYGASPPPTGGEESEPWFTGPLLTPSARNVPKGHLLLEPYLVWTTIYGAYQNDWVPKSIPNFYIGTNRNIWKYGLTDWVNLTGSLNCSYQKTQNVSSVVFNDLPLGLDFELYKGKDSDDKPIAFLKLSFSEVFPTGKYQHLNPKKLGTDQGGFGSYVSIVGLTFSKMYKITAYHYFRWRLNGSIAFYTPVNVKGINSYGGDPTTNGKVFPGETITALAGFEYSLTRNWALALDLQATYDRKNTFKGKTIAPVGGVNNWSYGIAPAVEYNFNADLGLITGAWFSVTGKNSPRFVSAMVALNCFF